MSDTIAVVTQYVILIAFMICFLMRQNYPYQLVDRC